MDKVHELDSLDHLSFFPIVYLLRLCSFFDFILSFNSISLALVHTPCVYYHILWLYCPIASLKSNSAFSVRHYTFDVNSEIAHFL